MRNLFLKLIGIIALLVLLRCSDNKEKQTSSANRPIDHWVFRTVLDANPRMITIALSDKIWAAYHVGTGALYKIWKGSVYFDGAVYTGAHGPQPISIGNAYFENKYKQPWFALGSKGDTITTTYHYKGHRILNGRAELMYQLASPSWKQNIEIYEQVEATQSSGGSPVFERVFTTKNVPSGVSLGMKFNCSSIVSESNIETDGKMIIVKKDEVKYDEITTLDVDGVLLLKSNAATKFNTTVITTPTIENKNIAGGVDEEEKEGNPGGLHPGLKLIARSDCKTCHNKNVKTIGPSYTDIANKYKNTPENIAMLAAKVKKGGSGIWGEQVMTAHADLPDEDAKEMVAYIMSLDNDAASEESATVKTALTLQSVSVKEDEMILGAITRIYDIPKNVSKMPVIDKNQKPKFAGVLGNFNNISGSMFKGLTENFMLQSTGYIKIDNPGLYTLQVWSDDGSIVYINDQKVMDNDGPHGPEMKDIEINFKKGYYPFRIDFYQGGGGNYLAFDWKKPGDKEYEIIPAANIVHNINENESLSGYSLPMSESSAIPGDGFPLVDVHPSFDLSQARPGSFKPKVGGIDFKKDGRMVVSTWDETGSLWIIKGHETGDTTKMTHKRIAFGLSEPLGVKVVGDTIYVMQKQEITRLIDTDGDDIIDEYQTLCDDWLVSANFHEFGFGLAYKDGFFYATLATAINPGGASTQPQIQDRGKAIKINKNTGEMSFVASGLRTPNGVGVGYKGEIFVADNQGDWLPASKIVHVREGAWFGSHSVDPIGTKDRKEDLPVVWLPQDEIGNSPSTPLAIDLGPYKGQMIHGEVTHGGVKRVFVEEVNGKLQGCVFRFIQGLEAGINRIAWGPDGSLYAGGIGNGGNWGQNGKQWYGLQRLKYNNKSTFEMLAVRARTNGLEIEFTEPLGYEADNKALYEVKQWYYKPTIDYGGPKLGETALPVKSATVSDDRLRVFLEIPGIKSNHVVYVHLGTHFVSLKSNSIWSTEAWYTMNEIPAGLNGISKPLSYDFAPNTLSPLEQKDGWSLLFDGKSMNEWRNYKKQTIGKSWIIQDEGICLNSIKGADGKWKVSDGGDIISKKKYKNFEFVADWKINNCGNSGIFFNVVEGEKYSATYSTGVEMQVLDNLCHPDSRFKTHRAGDLYDMLSCKYETVNAVGKWNQARIRSNNGKVDFWLNGYLVVSFTMHDDNWKKMIEKSKFKGWEGFGMSKDGHIALQDQGDKVWYRNIKIKELK
jgi:cytochrome c